MTKSIILYTDEELKQLTDDELVSKLKLLGFPPQRFRKICANIIRDIKRRTSFLDNDIDNLNTIFNMV